MPSIELGPTTPVSAMDLNASRLWHGAGAASPASTGAYVPSSDLAAKGGATTSSTAAVETSVSFDAGEPPIDTDRVALIRHAVENGTYPILPAKIADAMIAAGMLLRTGSHDQA